MVPGSRVGDWSAGMNNPKHRRRQQDERLPMPHEVTVKDVLEVGLAVGLRSTELVRLNVGDLSGDGDLSLRLGGRAGERTVPLSIYTARRLRRCTDGRPAEAPMF